VYEDWRAKFVDQDMSPVPGGDCEIVKIEKSITKCTSTLNIHRARKAGFIHLIQPPIPPRKRWSR
jgi:hypothetical protein